MRRAPSRLQIASASGAQLAGRGLAVTGAAGGRANRVERLRGRRPDGWGVRGRAAAAAGVLRTAEPEVDKLEQQGRDRRGKERGKYTYDDLDDDVKRAAWAERMGYTKIGKRVPDDVTVGDVVRTFPREVYQLDHGKAWRALFTTVAAICVSMTLVAISPWYLKPVSWFVAGTACTGLFVLGHECGHRVFHRSLWVNDLVGHLVMTPLIFPYHPWRLSHTLHHLHTNKLSKDTGWQPIMKEAARDAGPALRVGLRAVLGTPLKLWLSVYHWINWHFSFEKFPKYQSKHLVYLSWALVAAFAGTLWPWLIANHGIQGFLDFWLMPWLGYHFWMSTITMVHHTAPHIPFTEEEDYHAARAKLGGTVNCEYPRWVEVLTHDINVHIPHHLSSGIPFYNLRAATESLRQNWGQYMTEGRLNWRMMRNLLTQVHLYDKDSSYVAFDADGDKEEAFLALQRQVYPDAM